MCRSANDGIGFIVRYCIFDGFNDISIERLAVSFIIAKEAGHKCVFDSSVDLVA